LIENSSFLPIVRTIKTNSMLRFQAKKFNYLISAKYLRNTALKCYTVALTRDIDESLAGSALSLDKIKSSTIDLELAKKQHQNLTNLLRTLSLDVHTLPSDGFPDSVFIEDTCVIVDGVAVITSPGAMSRKNEVNAVKEYIEKNFSGRLKVVTLEQGTLDGGDVMLAGMDCFLVLPMKF
jgi:dimethylargininase